ncbi:hypothetical protein PATA110616_21085 [Paenibacillus tarimensis]
MNAVRILALLLSFMFIGTSACLADWAYNFVVYDGNSYQVTDDVMDEADIAKRVGEVTRYSDEEGTYSGNFSNAFPVGTQYYAIQGIAAD